MESSYPVSITVHEPERFERAQVVLRLLIGAAFAAAHLSTGGLFGFAYLFLPLIAALLISQHGGACYLQDDSPWLAGLLDWLVAFYAYMLFVTDRFPLDPNDRVLRVNISAGGCPSVKSALMRWLTNLPHFVLLLACGIASCIVAVIAAISVLIHERYPESLRSFQCSVIGWSARVLAYHASLVEVFPSAPMIVRSPAQQHDGPAQGVGQP